MKPESISTRFGGKQRDKVISLPIVQLDVVPPSVLGGSLHKVSQTPPGLLRFNLPYEVIPI